MGLDCYPKGLKGLGFRAAYSSDYFEEIASVQNTETNVVPTDSLWQQYGLFYAGIQYKF